MSNDGGYDVLPPTPDHHYFPGCCDQLPENHHWSEEEGQAVQDWLETEPGLMQRFSVALRRFIQQRKDSAESPEPG